MSQGKGRQRLAGLLAIGMLVGCGKAGFDATTPATTNELAGAQGQTNTRIVDDLDIAGTNITTDTVDQLKREALSSSNNTFVFPTRQLAASSKAGKRQANAGEAAITGSLSYHTHEGKVVP